MGAGSGPPQRRKAVKEAPLRHCVFARHLMFFSLAACASTDGCAPGDSADTAAEPGVPCGADVAPLIENACGPYAAIKLGRSWTWSHADGSGDLTWTVGALHGAGGTIQTIRGERLGTLEFSCDGGWILESTRSEYPSSDGTCSENARWNDPGVSIPATLALSDSWSWSDETTADGVCDGVSWDGGSYGETSAAAVATEIVSLTAGEFTSCKVDLREDFGGDVPRESTEWYAPGVGLVKSETLELRKWTP